MSFDILPTEVLQTIFRFFHVYDLHRVSLVCRKWAAAAEPILMARNCLAIAHHAFSRGFFARHAPGNRQDYNDDKPLQLLDILSKSNRNYTRLRVEWEYKTIKEHDLKTLQEILKVCRERYSLQKLHLKAYPCETLTDLFEKSCNWLDNLTELHFEQCRTLHAQPGPTIEISLPKLKRLTWLEENPRSSSPERINGVTQLPRIVGLNAFRYMSAPSHLVSDTTSCFQSAVLDVPELKHLKVKIGIRNETSRTDLDNHPGLEDADDCYLILPNLQLKSCSKLQRVDIDEVFQLDQRFLIQSKVFWQNLKTLVFFGCASHVTERIFKTCSNLQQLYINRTYGSITFEHISLLSSSLKHLTLNQVPMWFSSNELSFSELQSISLFNVTDECSRESITLFLNAPKLTKISIERLDYTLIRVADKPETATMILKLDPLHNNDATPHTQPLPNVTEVYLRLGLAYGEKYGLVQDYLNLCPNLRRLTIFGRWAGDRGLELNLEFFSNLEYLSGDGLVLRLADFHQLIHLKTLKLKECTLTANSDDDEVMLTTLKNIRLENVTLANRTWDHFPINGSELQSSMVMISAKVFSTS